MACSDEGKAIEIMIVDDSESDDGDDADRYDRKDGRTLAQI